MAYKRVAICDNCGQEEATTSEGRPPDGWYSVSWMATGSQIVSTHIFCRARCVATWITGPVNSPD
jgi:hypothetical protein